MNSQHFKQAQHANQRTAEVAWAPYVPAPQLPSVVAAVRALLPVPIQLTACVDAPLGGAALDRDSDDASLAWFMRAAPQAHAALLMQLVASTLSGAEGDTSEEAAKSLYDDVSVCVCLSGSPVCVC